MGTPFIGGGRLGNNGERGIVSVVGLGPHFAMLNDDGGGVWLPSGSRYTISGFDSDEWYDGVSVPIPQDPAILAGGANTFWWLSTEGRVFELVAKMRGGEGPLQDAWHIEAGRTWSLPTSTAPILLAGHDSQTTTDALYTITDDPGDERFVLARFRPQPGGGLSEEWRTRVGRPLALSVSDTRVVVATDVGVEAYNLYGSELWRIPDTGRLLLLSSSQSVYLVSDASLSAYDHNGHLTWSVPLPASAEVSSLAIDEKQRIWLGGSKAGDAWMRVFSASSGEILCMVD